MRRKGSGVHPYQTVLAEPAELPELDDGLDDEGSDPFEEVIDAADESRDSAAPLDAPTPPPAEPEPTATLPEPAPDRPEPFPARPLPAPDEVRALFSRLQVRKGTEGQIVIEAPPETASTLGALFEGMAALLRSAAEPDDGGTPG